MSRGQFYLDKSHAKLAGVCAGIANYTGVDALWIRIATVLLTLFVSFITIPIYIATAVLADKKPNYLMSDADEERMLRKMYRKRRGKVRSELDDMDRRVADIEAHYSTSNSRLAAEIDSLR